LLINRPKIDAATRHICRVILNKEELELANTQNNEQHRERFILIRGLLHILLDPLGVGLPRRVDFGKTILGGPFIDCKDMHLILIRDQTNINMDNSTLTY